MAITKGLFGFDPYEVQMQQTQRLLAPIAQATNPYERIGASLGTLLGASLFDVQDPRLAKASKITAITKQVMGDTIDPTDPKIVTKLENLSKALFNEGEADAAMFALEQARKFSPKDETVAVAPGGTLVNRRTGDVVFQADDREKIVKTSESAARAAGELGFGVRANLSDYSEQELRAINNLLQIRGEKIQAAGVPQSGQVKITDLSGAQGIVDRFTKEPAQRLTTVKQLGVSLREVKAGTGAALPQLERDLVKLVGDSQIGMGEVQRALGSVGIVGDAISGINKLFTGVPSAQKIADVEKFVKALEDEHAKSYNSGRVRAEKVLKEAKLSPETVTTLIPPAYKTGREKKAEREQKAAETNKKTEPAKKPAVTFQEGKVYRDANGNRARYVNGKWEPVK